MAAFCDGRRGDATGDRTPEPGLVQAMLYFFPRIPFEDHSSYAWAFA
jgi:hypothetical protein